MKKRIFALALCLLVLLPAVLSCNSGAGDAQTTPADGVDLQTPADTTPPADTTTAPPAEDSGLTLDTRPNAVIFATADFQGRNTAGGTSATGTTSDPNYNNGNAVASHTLRRIISNMQADGYKNVDATIFCGDYDIDNGNKASDSKAGIDAVRAVYTELGWDTTPSGNATTHIFVQGNHEERAPVGTNGLSGSNLDSSGKPGVFDTEHYGLYLLHEDYFPFKSSGYNDAKIDAAASELGEYLDAKLAAGYTKPIFIAAHVPLHYNLWMHSGLYAKPFFDVINQAAGQGLNIIYLFGHDHGGYDQYIGGTDIYLPAGSVMLVPDYGTKATKQAYAINFTYMSAGLCAYLIGDHSENQFSGSIFEIYDDRVIIKRYNDSTDRANNGLTTVGCVGEERANNTAAGLLHSYYSVEYNSPQTVTFEKQTTAVHTEAGVTVTAPGISSVEVSAGDMTTDGNKKSITYNIRPATPKGNYDGYGTVTLPLPREPASAALDELTVTAGGKTGAVLSYEGDVLSIWVPCFGQIEVTYTPKTLLTCNRVTAADIKDGGRYLIVAGKVQSISSAYNRQIVSPLPVTLSSPERVGLAMIDAGIGAAIPNSVTVDSKYVFTLTKSAEGWLFGREDGQYLYVGANSGGWASSGDAAYRVRQLKYNATGTPFAIETDKNGLVYISTPVEGGKYPCYMYVTSYGNSCLMDLPRDVSAIPAANVRISYYYIFEVQS